MLSHPEQCAAYREVELTIDMDGYGTVAGKPKHYQSFPLAPHAERAAIKLFYDWDQPLMSPERIQALDRPPDLVIYQ